MGGGLAASPVPHGDFALFGREHADLALGLVEAFTWPLPVGAMCFAAVAALASWPAFRRSGAHWALCSA